VRARVCSYVRLFLFKANTPEGRYRKTAFLGDRL